MKRVCPSTNREGSVGRGSRRERYQEEPRTPRAVRRKVSTGALIMGVVEQVTSLRVLE